MGVSRPTEMTIRDLLQEELRKRGVTVVPEFSVSTPVGRMMSDMLLKNGAQYVVETKLNAEVKHRKTHRRSVKKLIRKELIKRE
jgi:uncharacterized membrane-anchored protein YjiN (DUF445 family)